uniref:Uncharacterized protein n=1 Tax=Leptobrachium leishanense TaxID=445787 RepID=A0A8C5PK16_9ANUR
MKLFELSVLTDIEQFSSKNSTQNLTRHEKEALCQLAENREIVIKPADKGGGLVILSKEQYKKEALRILSDRTTYEPLSRDPTQDFVKLLDDLLNFGKSEEILNESEYSYLRISHPRIPFFYWLPKIHKDVSNPPGRPIISGVDSLTSLLSQYIDKQLQPYVLQSLSHFRDSINTWVKKHDVRHHNQVFIQYMFEILSKSCFSIFYM